MCIANSWYNECHISVFLLRLNREAYSLEFVNDGKTDTSWISTPDNPPNNKEQHSLQLDLKDIFEVNIPNQVLIFVLSLTLEISAAPDKEEDSSTTLPKEKQL